jgi:N-acyl-phosphatidylethanolamine-hydrolysing phospholipase D
VLFDPVFTPRCSPFTFMGPKRYTDIPCEIFDIPSIDAVIISHNHYDHLSHPTIMEIKEKHPNVHFFVPLGNKNWFLKCGIHNVTELDWWESRDIKLTIMKPASKSMISEVSVTESGEAKTNEAEGPETITATIGCLPCQHTSARGPFDRNHTLWASWSVESCGKKVWFAG